MREIKQSAGCCSRCCSELCSLEVTQITIYMLVLKLGKGLFPFFSEFNYYM